LFGGFVEQLAANSLALHAGNYRHVGQSRVCCSAESSLNIRTAPTIMKQEDLDLVGCTIVQTRH
jgi:hypothetical protein